jgi:transcription elongation factor GreA
LLHIVISISGEDGSIQSVAVLESCGLTKAPNPALLRRFSGIIWATPPGGNTRRFAFANPQFETHLPKIRIATIPITKRGAEKLKAELHQLKTVERPTVINLISEARAQGDLSENAEYDAAKDKQGFVEGRIQEIEGKLSAAQIIDPSELDAGGKVVFGSTIELEDEDTGDKVTYQIVGEDEADIKFGRVNISSPIARALIGKDEGDTAEVQAPGGVKRYEIIAVMYI